MIYFDSNYVVRLYAQDAGWEKVRKLAVADDIACSLHGHAESVAAFHRKLREGEFSSDTFRKVLAEFEANCQAGAFKWLPLTPLIMERLAAAYRSAPKTMNLRAGDALHLACAAENGFREIYSNDTRLLAAAAHFGLTGSNVI